MKKTTSCREPMKSMTFKVFSMLALFTCGIVASSHAVAQDIDLLIKNGRVIDPGNDIDGNFDVAITEGRITRVAPNIASAKAKKVIDAKGLIVCPGLIDLHTHVFVGAKPNTFADGVYSLSPDDFTFKSGVTTVVDAGTSGWQNFPTFKEQVIDQSKTRILAFLNIAAQGLSGKPEQEDLATMDAEKVAATLQQYPDILVGVKIGHYEGRDWTPFERALLAGSMANAPLLVECHLPEYSLEEQLRRMRPGDILTHSFEQVSERMPIVDEQGHLRSFVTAAQQRGILFDVGHGGAGFWFSQAIPAFRENLVPNSFGTDLHRFSMNAGMKDILNIMSKFLTLGMTVEDIILRATWSPAQALHRKDLGSLSPGTVADVTLLNLRTGDFGFVDAGGNRIDGHQKFEAELTIRGGKIVWDLNGLSANPISH